MESIIGSADALKSVSQIKSLLSAQFKEPEEDFVRFFASRIYDGALTAGVRKKFSLLVKRALDEYLNDKINSRLKSAIDNTTQSTNSSANEECIDEEVVESKIVTTDEEMDGFNIIKAIIRQEVDLSRVFDRDTQSYFGILLDNNNRKPVCRLHFNSKNKYIGIFNEDKKETKIFIDNLNDIFNYSDEILSSLRLAMNV
ncbi:MAG: hypothetical protein CENE_03764 [Candidatus Celerinatantimonas neptuna]|nr:MAG: hypothetical protein CENE_03764 [Candidatus Celerinatantimonas neptuna]